LPGESECVVTVTTGLAKAGKHLPVCTPISYETDPPNSGDHWPVWAAFKKYDAPVPHEMLVHDMEHGAVILLHNCAGACATDVKKAFNTVYDAQHDVLCIATGAGVEARMVMAPDTTTETPIALAAWGATYTATCIDPPSLADFVKQHYGHGPETLCANGVDETQFPSCN
jgi:hypothetical protein